jgi:hypothetical protein
MGHKGTLWTNGNVLYFGFFHEYIQLKSLAKVYLAKKKEVGEKRRHLKNGKKVKCITTF